MIFKETQESPITPLKEEDPKRSVVIRIRIYLHYFGSLDPKPYPDRHQIKIRIRIGIKVKSSK
jgi:hypothetical protein